MNKVLIIAAKQYIAQTYCKQKGIKKEQCIFISSMEQLRGLRDQEVTLLDGYLDSEFFKNNGDRSILATFKYRNLSVKHESIK